MTVTEAQRENLRTAFTDPALRLGAGVGSAYGARCTIAEINLILTGKLHDGPHPCISEVVRRWTIRIQDAIPATIRNSPEWRTAAIGIAGSASTAEAEETRRAMLLAWMWERLGDEAVLASIPQTCLYTHLTLPTKA
jgi:hypothetical protein